MNKNCKHPEFFNSYGIEKCTVCGWLKPIQLDVTADELLAMLNGPRKPEKDKPSPPT
jgi:hypothetical protein